MCVCMFSLKANKISYRIGTLKNSNEIEYVSTARIFPGHFQGHFWLRRDH